MSGPGVALGRRGEQEAARFLQRAGFQILATDVRVGRGQLDLIALEGNVVCVVEVKTRASRRRGSPAESVTAKKQAQIVRTAVRFLQRQRWGSCPDRCQVRFDVVAVDVDEWGQAHCELFRQAFDPGATLMY